MKKTLFILAIIVTVISSCKKNDLPSNQALNPPVSPAIILADSVDGTYTGTDLFHYYMMSTGSGGTDTTYNVNVSVSISLTASNTIIIGSQTYTLSATNSFTSTTPNSDIHVFDGGNFTFDSQGHATMHWNYGSAYMSGHHYHDFLGTR
jgi:hypothetical protein